MRYAFSKRGKEKEVGILVVDDDTGTINALRASLMSHGYQVWVAKDGSQALGMLSGLKKNRSRVDVMLTDLRMPGMDGLELIRQSRRKHPELAIVLMTAFGGDHLNQEAQLLGFVYLEKPFKPERLVEIIREQPIHGGSLGSVLEGESHQVSNKKGIVAV